MLNVKMLSAKHILTLCALLVFASNIACILGDDEESNNSANNANNTNNTNNKNNTNNANNTNNTNNTGNNANNNNPLVVKTEGVAFDLAMSNDAVNQTWSVSDLTKVYAQCLINNQYQIEWLLPLDSKIVFSANTENTQLGTYNYANGTDMEARMKFNPVQISLKPAAEQGFYSRIRQGSIVVEALPTTKGDDDKLHFKGTMSMVMYDINDAARPDLNVTLNYDFIFNKVPCS